MPRRPSKLKILQAATPQLMEAEIAKAVIELQNDRYLVLTLRCDPMPNGGGWYATIIYA